METISQVIRKPYRVGKNLGLLHIWKMIAIQNIKELRKQSKKYTPKPNDSFKQWVWNLNIVLELRKKMATKYLKCWTSLLAIKEMQTKTSFRFYLIPVRMTKWNNQLQILQGMQKE